MADGEKRCEACGGPVAGKRARFCSGAECRRERARNRKRASRGQVIEFPGTLPVDGSVFGSTLRVLESAQRVECPDGQAALVLAQRLDNAGFETGASLASVSREFRAALEAALRDAPRAEDRVDELRARRARRFGSG